MSSKGFFYAAHRMIKLKINFGMSLKMSNFESSCKYFLFQFKKVMKKKHSGKYITIFSSMHKKQSYSSGYKTDGTIEYHLWHGVLHMLNLSSLPDHGFQF